MSVSEVSTIAIAGISGKLGQLVARHVLGTSKANIRGFCRDKSKVPSDIASDPHVSLIEGQSNDGEAVQKAVHGSDVVICCYLGPDDLMLNGQKLLIDIAVSEKVPRYIASDYTLDYTKLELGQLPSKDPMIEIKKYLEEKPIKGVHIFIGCFTETGWVIVGFDPKNYVFNHWGTGDEKWDFTTYDTAAQYTAAVALDPKASGVLKCKSSLSCLQFMQRDKLPMLTAGLQCSLTVRDDHISIKGLGQCLKERYGHAPRFSSLGSLDDLRKRIDDARPKGVVGWDVMRL